MKVLNQRLTPEAASQLCLAISIIEQTRPRLINILRPNILLCKLGLAHTMAVSFLNGDMVVFDSKNLKGAVHAAGTHTLMKLQPVEILPIELYYIEHSTDCKFGPYRLEEFESILPDLEVDDISLVHQALEHPRPLRSMIRTLLKSSF